MFMSYQYWCTLNNNTNKTDIYTKERHVYELLLEIPNTNTFYDSNFMEEKQETR